MPNISSFGLGLAAGGGAGGGGGGRGGAAVTAGGGGGGGAGRATGRGARRFGFTAAARGALEPATDVGAAGAATAVALSGALLGSSFPADSEPVAVGAADGACPGATFEAAPTTNTGGAWLGVATFGASTVAVERASGLRSSSR